MLIVAIRGGVSDSSRLAVCQTLSTAVSTKSVIFSSFSGVCRVFEENQSTPRPSEHPPVMGENFSKRLGGIKSCKYKISSWHLNRLPDADNIGSTV